MAARDRPPTRISPSLLASDFGRLAEEAAAMVAAGAEWLHVDIMVRSRPRPPFLLPAFCWGHGLAAGAERRHGDIMVRACPPFSFGRLLLEPWSHRGGAERRLYVDITSWCLSPLL